MNITDSAIRAHLTAATELVQHALADAEKENAKFAAGIASHDAQRRHVDAEDHAHDDRVNCTDCQHSRGGRCGNHRQAGLNVTDIGRDWMNLSQRCSGFKPQGATP